MAEPRPRVAGSEELGRRPLEIPALVASQRVCMVVLLCVVLWSAGRSAPVVWLVVSLFAVAAGFGLWRATTGRVLFHTGLAYFWGSALVVLVVARGTDDGMLLLVLFLFPLTMCTLVHGLWQGLALGAASALGWLLDLSAWGIADTEATPTLALLLMPLICSLAARPTTALRQRNQMVLELNQQLDPRRGLVAVGLQLGERLRHATAARRVLLCHRDAEEPTVLVCDAEDGAFEASPALSARVLTLLARLPVQPLSLDTREGPASPAVNRPPATGERAAIDAAQRALAQLLEAELLHLVPDVPGKANAGWTLVAYGGERGWRNQPWPLQVLAGLAADLRRVLQQASHLDLLQAEIAAHERSRIGRDLHDSALQPYLGLKFAIEALALRSEPGHALHPQIQELRSVCDAELVELRKTVSALRSGGIGGDNSLSAALHRQCSRFARLFDIQVELQVPAEVPASRTLVNALLHMVNEGLNNVRRHTPARRVWIQLSETPGALHLVMRDDGGRHSGQAAPVFEPRSLSERARELGGTLQLRHHDGLDTEIQITLPV